MLKLKNTLTGEIEEFKPINPDEVRMYNCGPTVYNYPHIGNLRSYIFADTLRRALELNGFMVKQVINLTDVGQLSEETAEDKIEVVAEKEGKKVSDIAEYFSDVFKKNLEDLNIDTSKIEFPTASKHIDEQINFIKKLEEKGFTYTTSEGVYFDTSKFPEYGKLGNINIEGLEEGARIEGGERKNKTDFALWRFSGKKERQQEWESPWGKGFPGWHIECSAMSMKYLGEHFDIHTGGIDHIPTHHNNEIAQSEALTGEPFVNYWLHNAFLNIKGEKISKSLGNIITLDDLKAKGFLPAHFRYWLLQARYSTAVDFSEESLLASKNALNRLITLLSSIKEISEARADDEYLAIFKGLINDDLDTPKTLALLWELVHDDSIIDATKKATIYEFDKVLGLGVQKLEEEQFLLNKNIPEDVLVLSKERDIARENKDWEKSDELREKIESLGFEVRDIEEGSKITKKN